MGEGLLGGGGVECLLSVSVFAVLRDYVVLFCMTVSCMGWILPALVVMFSSMPGFVFWGGGPVVQFLSSCCGDLLSVEVLGPFSLLARFLFLFLALMNKLVLSKAQLT